MSGKALSRMREILNSTGIYRLTGESSADWETNACGAGFSLLENALESLLGSLFALLSPEEGLDRWEKLFRPQVSSDTLERRRNMLHNRLSMNPGRFSPGEFSSMIYGAGVEGEVLEDGEGLRVLLGRTLGVTEEEARRELDQVLPAHLPWEWDDSVNWTALDAWAPDFETLDARELSWDEVDVLTRERLKLLEEEEE